jgi:hypothetical protein
MGGSGRILVHLKGGKTLIWYNYTEKDNRYCTWIGDGELCINKNDVPLSNRNNEEIKKLFF